MTEAIKDSTFDTDYDNGIEFNLFDNDDNNKLHKI